MKHNVSPTGRAGYFRCTCGARATTLEALEHHIANVRSVASIKRSDRLLKRAIRLMAELEVLTTRRIS